MGEEHIKPTRPAIPRVDADAPAPTHRGLDTDAILGAIAGLKSHVDARLDATEQRLDEKINEQGHTIDERFRAAEESRQAQARAVRALHDGLGDVVKRVGKLEDDGKRPSAPPRTASGMMRLAGDVAKGTISAADMSLEKSLADVKIALSSEIAGVRGVNESQNITLRAIQTAAETAATSANAAAKSAANAAESAAATRDKKVAWHEKPLFQQVVLIIAVLLSSIIAATYSSKSTPVPSMNVPSLPH